MRQKAGLEGDVQHGAGAALFKSPLNGGNAVAVDVLVEVLPRVAVQGLGYLVATQARDVGETGQGEFAVEVQLPVLHGLLDCPEQAGPGVGVKLAGLFGLAGVSH